MEPAWDSVSLSLCPSPAPTLCLSKINRKKLKKNKAVERTLDLKRLPLLFARPHRKNVKSVYLLRESGKYLIAIALGSSLDYGVGGGGTVEQRRARE